MNPIDEFKSGYDTAKDSDATLLDALEGPADGGYGSALDDDAKATLDRKVTDLQTEGWQIKKKYDDRVVMRYGDLGSWVVHILLLALTAGIGNLVYAWYRWTRYGQQKVVRP